MSFEKRNVVEEKRTPKPELTRPDEHWDKDAADKFMPPATPVVKPDVPAIEKRKA